MVVFAKKDGAVRHDDNSHADDDLLERYSMGRLAGAELDRFEEHLLLCPQCQDNLAATDAHVQGMRSASAEWQRQHGPAARSRKLSDLPLTARVLGLAALGLFLAVGIPWRLQHRPNGLPALVTLEALRGTENPSKAAAPAGKPLILELDSTDLQPLSSYKLEIVDADGRPAFESSAAAANHKLRAAVPNGLPGGMYYVRLFAPGAELLREYALLVR